MYYPESRHAQTIRNLMLNLIKVKFQTSVCVFVKCHSWHSNTLQTLLITTGGVLSLSRAQRENHILKKFIYKRIWLLGVWYDEIFFKTHIRLWSGSVVIMSWRWSVYLCGYVLPGIRTVKGCLTSTLNICHSPHTRKGIGGPLTGSKGVTLRCVEWTCMKRVCVCVCAPV